MEAYYLMKYDVLEEACLVMYARNPAEYVNLMRSHGEDDRVKCSFRWIPLQGGMISYELTVATNVRIKVQLLNNWDPDNREFEYIILIKNVIERDAIINY